MPQAMKIPDAKAAAEKEWEKLEKIPAWDTTKVRNKSEMIDDARTKGAKVHFASLMDFCHLKNAELKTKHQKYKGRVELRGDIVKDDSGSYAVFTEQGSSASQTSHGYQRSLQKFLEPNRKPKVIYTDNSLEFGKSCEDLSWKHCTSTHHTDRKQMGLLREQYAE